MPVRTKKVVYEDEFQAAAGRALEACYRVAKAAYGPKAGVAWIENTYGDPLVSRDGVTNLDTLYLANPTENMVARAAIQASRQSDKQVGDGTTAVVILTYHLYKVARKLVGSGTNRMEVVEHLNEMASNVDTYIAKHKKEADNDILRSVAKISCSDAALGELIADTLEEVGAEGGVTVEDYSGDGVYTENTQGFYWPRGYTNIGLINDQARLESRFEDVAILITEKRLATASDIAPIIDKIVGAKINNLVIVGEVDQEALAVLAAVRLQGVLTATPVDVPAYAGKRTLMLDDLALVTDGQVLLPGTPVSEFTVDMLGAAERVVITDRDTSIIGREASAERIAKRVKDLQGQYNKATETSDKEALRERISRLKGKMAIIHVGASTDIEQRETKLRVQDAVRAVQAASVGGVVAGGGVCLAMAAQSLRNTAFKGALESPFKDLVNNAGENSELYLSELDPAKPWQGFDLNHDEGEPDDLLVSGVVDPAYVIEQAVHNAVSIVGKIITGTVAMTFKDRELRHE